MNTPPVKGASQDTAGNDSAQKRREPPVMLLSIAGAVAFGLVCWFAFPHVYSSTRQWMARRQLTEFRQQLKDENWHASMAAIQAARRWAPTDPEVVRAGLELIAAIGGEPRSTIALIKQLQESGAATDEELALSGLMHARLGEVRIAQDIYDQLTPEARAKPNSLELESELLRVNGHRDASQQVLREALLKRTDDEQSLRQLASIDIASNDPSRRKAMRERLWQITDAGTALSLTAVELLAQTDDLTVPQVAKLEKQVEMSVNTKDQREVARLRVLSARMRLSPQLRNSLIDEELSRWKDQTPAKMKPLVTWLAEEHEYARLLRMIPVGTASRFTVLLPSYVEALRGTKRWQELHTLVTSRGIDPACPKQKLRLWQAEAQIHLDTDPEPVRRILVQTFDEAGRGTDLSTTLQVGTLAEQLNQWDLAQTCYQAVADKHRQTQETLLPKIFQMAGFQHDGAAMLKACSLMLARKPENVLLLTQKLYLQYLLGIELETAHLQLENLTNAINAAHGDHLHLLRALAAYREGESDRIREALGHVAKPESMNVGERAVYAALLKKTGGDPGQIFRLVERISPVLLLPEEKVFLQRAL